MNQQPDEINPIVPAEDTVGEILIADTVARNVPIEPRRSNRKPLYTKEYIKYRESLHDDGSVETSGLSEDEKRHMSMTVLDEIIHDHDPAKP